MATLTRIAFKRSLATCSWTSSARIAAATKSSVPAPAASAPNAARARVVVKVAQADSRPLMQLEIFTLCDAATEHAGKLNIIGTFDALRAFEAPIAHPQCAIAGRLRFEQIEEGEHRVMLTFADEDGNIVMPKFGEYTVDLAVDGRQLGSLPLYVTKLERAG